MTERLYYVDSYLTEFDATVIGRDGGRIYLDRSAFYPTSGGQPFDVGVLRSAAEAWNTYPLLAAGTEMAAMANCGVPSP